MLNFVFHTHYYYPSNPKKQPELKKQSKIQPAREVAHTNDTLLLPKNKYFFNYSPERRYINPGRVLLLTATMHKQPQHHGKTACTTTTETKQTPNHKANQKQNPKNKPNKNQTQSTTAQRICTHRGSQQQPEREKP
jgi:hypothetical protein